MNKFLINLIPSRKIRQKLNKKVALQKKIREQNKVAEYLRRNYINPLVNSKLPLYEILPKKKMDTDKIIWQYWGQGVDETTPKIVKLCFESVNKYKGDYQQIILTNDTIKDYLDIPEFVYDKLNNNDEFTYTFFSDLLRVMLLSAYGGVWIDATVLLTDKIDASLLAKDFFMFQRTEKPADYKFWKNFNADYFCWDDGFRVNLLNSFIVAKKNNLIINSILSILMNYWNNETHFIHYFLFQIMFDELMRVDSYKKLNCEKVSDLLPHLLQVNIQKTYSEDLWNDITSKSHIHKLTYFYQCNQSSILEHLYYNFAPQSNIKLKEKYENITFCTMLFNIGKGKIDKIKNKERNFEDFYLESLKKLSENYPNIVMWCDEETQDYISKNHLNNIITKVMTFEELPYYKNKGMYLNFLKQMKSESFNQGYLLRNLEPEDVVDYLICVLSKIDIIKWAKDNDFYQAEYFYWIDAGINNEIYYRCWKNFDGVINADTTKAKFTFMTYFRKIYSSIIGISTFEDIALIKAPFEIPASMFLMNKNVVDDFYDEYKAAILFLEKRKLITTEQSVFYTMLNRNRKELFEFAVTSNYVDVMNLVAKSDNIVPIKNDKLRLAVKKVILTFAELIHCRRFTNFIKQKYLYRKK